MSSKAKPRRGKRLGRKVGSGKYSGIKLIDTRPLAVEDRANFGHFGKKVVTRIPTDV
jgi:hypothetical protein